MLDWFSDRVMRYRPGWIEWECRDETFPGLTVSVAATTLADANGVTARIASKGARPGDKALWVAFTPDADKGASYRVKPATGGYALEPEPARELGNLVARFGPAAPAFEALAYADQAGPEKEAGTLSDVLGGSGVVASVPLLDAAPQSMAIIADENDPPSDAKLVLRKTPLDPSAVADPVKAFQLGMARAMDFSKRLVINTPDPYLNAAAPMAVAAAAGIFVNPTFVHGGAHWRQQQPGWRTMGGAIHFGWPDQIQRAVEFWGNLQVKEDDGTKKHAEYSPNGCQQAGNSRFFGKGFIDYKQPPHYEFQTQFFDEAMFYTEWAMERFILPYSGGIRQTSNFVPGQWSIRELYHGDNFGMALGYFLCGQGDEGWNIMRGTMLETMYGDGVPKSGYSNETGGFASVNRISPGGLSHPNCSVDFADIVSAYSRALIEGLFGYRPDYPNGLVRMEPAFPADWKHASIRTPDFALEFKDNTYKLALTKPAKLRFGVPAIIAPRRFFHVREYCSDPCPQEPSAMSAAPGKSLVSACETAGYGLDRTPDSAPSGS